MTVITISRQFGSGGDEIASRLCELLGYKEFDKRLITQAAKDVGLSEQEVVDFSEESHKIRSFLERLFNQPQSIGKTRVWKEDASGARVAEEFNLTEASAVALVQKAVNSAYHTGNLVIVGRGGQVILKDRPGVLHIRVVGTIEDRIQRSKAQMKLNKSDFNADINIRREAQDWILHKDEASRDYLRLYYQVDWEDPTLYHLTVNTSKLGIEPAAQMIASLARTVPAAPATTEKIVMGK